MRFLQACQGLATDRPPIWFMRQAGRVLPEYCEARKSLTLLDLYEEPGLCARLGALPVERFGVDAAAVVTDIRLPLVAMGLAPAPADDEAPAAAEPAPAAPPRLRAPVDSDFGRLPETVALTCRALAGSATVLAQVGAPFTLAASITDAARPSDPARLRGLIYGDASGWTELADLTTAVALRSAQLQVQAGAQVVHVYDSWVGRIDADDYRALVLPWSRRLFDGIAALGVPAIHFALGAGHLLEAMCEAGGEVIGIDWRVDLDEAFARVGAGRGVQGNLDPTLLVGPLERVLARAASVLSSAGERPGFVFGLGHGLLPSTRPDVLHALVRYVHTFFS
ncbi:MAG: hypothetical protein MUF60_01805 [Vicinamibacterales bacterium]|nr:hypothetical protein [Vicinamibacterales bacterium]